MALQQDQDPATVQARIGARPLADGRIEFGLQLEGCPDDGIDLMEEEESVPCQQVWGERILPRIRKFPSNPNIGNWYSSSPPTLVGDVETRIRVRRLEDGRTEFALQQKRGLGEWGEHVLPSSRFLSEAARNARPGHWANSSPVTLLREIPAVALPRGVPVIAEGGIEWAELDGLTYNGVEPSFYYVVGQDPLDDSYHTSIVKRVRTDDSDYSTIRLEITCGAGMIFAYLWEVNLPYQTSDRSVTISYRFDDSEITTESWTLLSTGTDNVFPPDMDAFADRVSRSNRLVVRMRFYLRTITAVFTDVSQMFRTPVQPNIDYCGHY